MTNLSHGPDIFDQMCTDYEQKLGVPLIHNGDADRADVRKMCIKYKNNYPFVRAMWNHYLDDEGEERFGYTLDNFMTPRRLSKCAVRAYKVMHQYDKVEETGHFYVCENLDCVAEVFWCNADVECLHRPCPRCKGRLIREEVRREREMVEWLKSKQNEEFE